MSTKPATKPVDWTISERIRNLVNARMGECVANVARAFLRYRSELPPDAKFTEGIWMYGGQAILHTWIETVDSVIDPTLACETNVSLRYSSKHYRLRSVSERKIAERFRDKAIEPGVFLQMTLTWSDPDVEALRKVVDPP